jgi:serine/threonine protein kinase
MLGRPLQTEEGRLEIAGREQQVYSWLRDRDEELERNLLTPKLDEIERSVNYWEIYDRRRRMQRLSDFASTEARSLTPPEKIELARQLLAAIAGLHRQDAAHLDLGGHSIWIESPTTVKLSHLLAARYPDVKTLGKSHQIAANVTLDARAFGFR